MRPKIFWSWMLQASFLCKGYENSKILYVAVAKKSHSEILVKGSQLVCVGGRRTADASGNSKGALFFLAPSKLRVRIRSSL